jgi:hypothetical protein
MKRIPLYQLIAIVAFVMVLGPCFALAGSPLTKGGMLPDIDLPIPDDPAHKAYLGLSGEGLFKIPQIRAELVIIEIFSMY